MLNSIEVNPKTFDLTKTLRSGQVFGWRVLNNIWFGFIKNHIIGVYQQDNRLYYYGDIEEKDVTDYFNLGAECIYENIQPKDATNYELRVIKNALGIHILHQDFIETVITMMITPRNRIENTERICNKLREARGSLQSITVNDVTVEMYTFPGILELWSLDVEEAKALGMGFRSKAIVNACDFLFSNSDYENKLSGMSDIEIINNLKQINGIGDKVANCIALFSLQRFDMFPIDVHLEHIIAREYNGYFNRSRYKGCAGIIQQFMYYDEAIMNR